MNKILFFVMLCISFLSVCEANSSDKLELADKKTTVSSSDSEEIELFISNGTNYKPSNHRKKTHYDFIKKIIQCSAMTKISTKSKIYFGLATVSIIIILSFIIYNRDYIKFSKRSSHNN